MSFDIKRLRRADQIVGGSAIAFLIVLFVFKWYGASVSASIGGVSFSKSLNGWQSFTNSRWIWLITIIVALVAVAAAGGALKLRSPVPLSVVVAALGGLSTALIFYRIVHHPTAGASGTIGTVHYSASVGIKIGIWLGLIAAAGVTYGGYAGMREASSSSSDVHAQAGEAVGGPGSSGAAGAAPGAPAAAPPAPAPAPAAGSAEPPLPPPAAPLPPAGDEGGGMPAAG